MKYAKILLFLILTYHSNGEVPENKYETFISLSGSIIGSTTHAMESTGCTDGSISLDISNPNGPFYIQWSNGEITETIADLSPGEYCMTVTDDLCGEARGCWQIRCCPFMLEDGQIQYNISHPACEGQPGEVELTISDLSNDQFPLNIYLENVTDSKKFDLVIPSATSTFTDISQGDYKAQVNYGDGCAYNFEFNIEYKPIEIQYDKTASCDNDGTIQVNAFEVAPIYLCLER